MDKVIQEFLEKPTSPNDLYNLAKKKFNIYLYKDIKDFDDIEDLFNRGNSQIEIDDDSEYDFDDSVIVLMYNSSPTFGHWCCLSKNDYGYNFMDSYGDLPDFSLEYSDPEFNKNFGQDKKYLAGLLMNADEDVYYNHIPLQELSNNSATCGRYCALYLRFRDMKIDDFAKMIKKLSKNLGISCDELVVFMGLV